MKTDVVIVGAGPAGIFTALEMIKGGSDKKIIIVEKGVAIEKRSCPKSKPRFALTVSPTAILPPAFPERVHFPTVNFR